MFVTVDLDKVLMQNPFSLGVFPEVRRLLKHVVPAEKYGAENPDVWITKQIYAKHASRLRRGDWVASLDWDALINELAQEVGYTEDIDVTALVRQYCTPQYIAAYPDARPTLEWLRAEVDSLWWISNGYSCYQVPVLQALGLDKLFDGYFAPDTHGGIKPFPPLFEAAAESAGEEITAGVHIGDLLTNDVAGAKMNGLLAVWLDRELPLVFAGRDPWELPQDQVFQTYVEDTARREFCFDAYHFSDAQVYQPDVVISSLAQLPDVLGDLRTHLGRASSGRTAESV